MKFMMKTVLLAFLAWLLLCCFFPGVAWGESAQTPAGGSNASATEPKASATEPKASATEPKASAYCTPNEVQIGEPFTLTLDILHQPGLHLVLDEGLAGEPDDFGNSWVVEEQRKVLKLPLGDGSGRELTQVQWRVFGLEPGDFELTCPGADAMASGTVLRIQAALAKVSVLPELLEGEDQARELVGFREAPEVEEGPLSTILFATLTGVVSFVLLLLVLALRWWRRRSGERSWGAGPSPLARLAGLDPSDEDQARELHYRMAHLTRSALDGVVASRSQGDEEPAPQMPSGLTDEEWVLTCRSQAQLAPEILLRAEQLLMTCAQVKYGASTPTRWATTESWEEAKAICRAAEAMIGSQHSTEQTP